MRSAGTGQRQALRYEGRAGQHTTPVGGWTLAMRKLCVHAIVGAWVFPLFSLCVCGCAFLCLCMSAHSVKMPKKRPWPQGAAVGVWLWHAMYSFLVALCMRCEWYPFIRPCSVAGHAC